jgi:hypothetical protein
MFVDFVVIGVRMRIKKNKMRKKYERKSEKQKKTKYEEKLVDLTEPRKKVGGLFAMWNGVRCCCCCY